MIRSLGLSAFLFLSAVQAYAQADRPPNVEPSANSELLVAAGLSPIIPGADFGGDLIRYTLRRGWYGRSSPTAQIIQAEWRYQTPRPRVVLIELVGNGGVWRATERREAFLHPVQFDRLVRNVTAAAQVIGERSSRGSMTICSHAHNYRLEVNLPDEQQLFLLREAHCSDSAPAVMAGRILTAAVEGALSREQVRE